MSYNMYVYIQLPQQNNKSIVSERLARSSQCSLECHCTEMRCSLLAVLILRWRKWITMNHPGNSKNNNSPQASSDIHMQLERNSRSTSGTVLALSMTSSNVMDLQFRVLPNKILSYLGEKKQLRWIYSFQSATEIHYFSLVAMISQVLHQNIN